MRWNVFRRAERLPATLIVAFLLFDTTAPLVLAHLPTLFGLLSLAKGIVVAQSWLLAVGAALGPPPWMKRLSLALLLSVLSTGLFEHGLIYVVTFGFSAGIRQVFLAPMELVVLALPLLVLRGRRGWRLSLPGSAAEDIAQRFSLRQLFLGTAIVAACVAFAQLGVAELPMLNSRGPTPDGRWLLIGDCVECLFFGVVAVIPLTWLCLSVRLGRAVALLSFLAVTMNGVAIVLMCEYWTGRQLDEGLAGLVYTESVPLTFAGTLLLLRRAGALRWNDGSTYAGSLA